MSVDDIADIPPWRKKPTNVNSEKSSVKNPPSIQGKPAPKIRKNSDNAPPSLVGESASVMSLDDRKEKREKERMEFKKFLMEKRNNKVCTSQFIYSMFY